MVTLITLGMVNLVQNLVNIDLSFEGNKLFKLCIQFISFFKKDFISRESKAGREGETHGLVASCMPLTRDLAPKPGMCLGQEWRPSGLRNTFFVKLFNSSEV